MRGPSSEIEVNILGEDAEIMIAPWHHCEKCGEQFLNLTALGYCVTPSDNMMDLLAEYRDEHGS
jgi:hypothetical protein